MVISSRKREEIANERADPDFGGDEEWKDCSTGFGCETQGGHSNNDLRRYVYGSF